MSSEVTTRVVAIILGLLLWTYVRITPTSITRVIRDVPVSMVGMPQQPAMEYTINPQDRTVDVLIKGIPELVNNVLRDEVKAHIDVGKMNNPGTVQLGVEVDLPRGVKLAQKLTKVVVSASKLYRDDFPITISFIQQPQTGAIVGEYRPNPDSVVIEGPRDVIRQRVKYVIVRIDPTRPLATEEFKPVPVDDAGEQVNNVRVLTPTIQVSISSPTGKPTTREIAVGNPVLVNPPRGVTVTVEKAQPKSVMLSGDANVLSKLGAFVETEPLDVSDVYQETVRPVRLIVPKGLTVVGGKEGLPKILVYLQVHPLK